ncbi:hypothetical protein JXB41_00675 [Candidatus Woesearchaeota archaeon]|nr:hypothetical protein [Candidatus Woesearchaeota archaeon]
MSKKSEEELTIDFSKILKFFKGSKQAKKTKSKETEEEITIDSKKLISVFAKYSVFLLVLIPIILNIHFRLYPNYLPITDDFATQSVYNYIRSDIANQVNSEYPNLPQQNKDALINERFNIILNQQKDAVEQAVKQNSEFLKSKFKDENGYTYLGDIDSYFYMRYARNIVEKGHYGDEIRQGKNYDTYMIAPLGTFADHNLYPYIEAIDYKLLKLFEPKMTYMQAAFLTPLFISTIAIIVAFLVGKKLAGNIGGFFAAMIIATHPNVLSRSLGSDNDIVNIVFPLIILFFFIWSITSEKRRNKLIYAALSGFFIGFYSFAWTGWWYIFYFLIGSLVFYLMYHLVFHFKSIRKKPLSFFEAEVKNILLILFIFLFFSGVSLALFGKSNELFDLVNKPMRITRLKEAARGASLWPNVYTTVAELNPASLGETIDGVGSRFFFVIALMGIISTLVDFKKQKIINLIYLSGSLIWFVLFINNTGMNLLLFLLLLSVPILVGIYLSIIFKYKIDIKYAILLITWFLATIYAASKGIRFILLLVPPFAIAFSISIGLAYDFLVKFASNQLYINKTISKIIVITLLLILLVNPIKAGQRVARQYMPHVNDGWYDTLTKIKQESSQDAIVNSWWDFGHWFKYLADRRVTFDGASQNRPMAHWIGKALLTDDEDMAIGILRMLDCGSNSAFEVLNEETGDMIKTIDVLNEIILLDKTKAEKVLEKYAGEEKAAEILELTHCEPPENYFITSEDMVGKSGVWAHFGIWSFERAKIYYYYQSKTKNEFIQALVNEFDYSEEDARKMYENELMQLRTDRAVNDWIAAWPSYGGITGCSKKNNKTIICNLPAGGNQYIPLSIDIEEDEAYIDTQDNQIMHPAKFGYIKDDEFIVKEYEKDKLPNDLSIVLLNQTGTYQMILMSPELTGSMFTRLFYLDGFGLKHFEKFSDITDVQGQRIIVWKVNWNP